MAQLGSSRLLPDRAALYLYTLHMPPAPRRTVSRASAAVVEEMRMGVAALAAFPIGLGYSIAGGATASGGHNGGDFTPAHTRL